MYIKYVGNRTRESIVLEWAHVKYELSEKNNFTCEIPSQLFSHIITPDRADTFIPCDAPAMENTPVKKVEEAPKKKGRK